jgi:hypothetical protein
VWTSGCGDPRIFSDQIHAPVALSLLYESIVRLFIRCEWSQILKKKGNAIRVTGRGGPQGCETSRFPHFLDSRLTDGGEVVSLTYRQPFTSRKIPGTHFSQTLNRLQDHSAAGRIRSTEKYNDLIGN